MSFNRRAISVRTRFEVFKRDGFTCRYCARTTPAVVLEIDHIVPICDGGSDDPINLVTSCWDCNRGKSGVPLTAVIEGEDPGDRAVILLERERQLREYNEVLRVIRARKESDAEELLAFWCDELSIESIPKKEFTWLLNQLDHTAAETIRHAMRVAIGNGRYRDFRYVAACLRNWREEGAA